MLFFLFFRGMCLNTHPPIPRKSVGAKAVRVPEAGGHSAYGKCRTFLSYFRGGTNNDRDAHRCSGEGCLGQVIKFVYLAAILIMPILYEPRLTLSGSDQRSQEIKPNDALVKTYVHGLERYFRETPSRSLLYFENLLRGQIESWIFG